jgi:hypothetical protein
MMFLCLALERLASSTVVSLRVCNQFLLENNTLKFDLEVKQT